MFKRRALDLTEDLIQGEKSVYEAIYKLTTAREKAQNLEVRWANGEDNPLMSSLFMRLAKIQWMYNEATKQMAEKHLELSKAFKRIFQEEKLLDETRKDLQTALSKKAKLQKQIDSANKKSDHIKAQSLEAELNTQTTLCGHLTSSVEAKAQKQELYKVSQLKKALVCQAEGVITLSGHCQQLYASQMQLIDLLPDSPTESTEKKSEIERRMSAVVGKVSELLDIHPPPKSGVVLKNTSTQSSSNEISEKEKFAQSMGTYLPGIGSALLKRHKSADNLIADDPTPKPDQENGQSNLSNKSENIRPEVNYTQGMYCEIVIPELDNGVPRVHDKGVPMRRSQSGSSPLMNRHVTREKHRSAITLDEHTEVNNELSRSSSKPLDTDSESTSLQFSSSEDLGLADEEPDAGYARLTILPSPSSLRSSPTSPEVDDQSDYAKPADVVPFESPFNFQKQQRKPRRGLTTSPPIPEGRSLSPYEQIEDIQKLKQEQKGEANRRKALSPQSSKVDVFEDDKGRPLSCKDDEHIYSRPFDAVSLKCPLKVSMDAPKNQLSIAPPVRKVGSNEKITRSYPTEKSVKSFHKTSLDGENRSSSPVSNSRAAKGRSASAKNSWKVLQGADTLAPPLTVRNDTKSPENTETHSQFVIETNQSPEDSTSPLGDRRIVGRVSSTGSVRNIAVPLKPVAVKVNKLRTGQATVISGGGLKGPPTKPKPKPVTS